jgi:mono/diheme cytochrome c family protein
MRRILKWVGIVAGGLLGLIVIAIVILYSVGTAKINKTFEVQVAEVVIPTDQAAIERGEHFVQAIALCQVCHTSNLGGEVSDDDPLFGVFAPRNLTSGRGGVGETFNDIDYVRAIRHGIGRDGKALIFMPAEIYNEISDADLGAIIAYLKSLPPVDNELPDSSFRLLGRIFAAMEPEFLPANMIDHDAARPAEPVRGVTKEYGQYLSFSCSLCHGDDLAGGTVPGDEPDAPMAPNITPGGAPGNWNQAQFVSTLRTGITPSGKVLDAENMPWPYFTRMTDDELEAIWLYLKSLPAREFEE